MPTSTLLSDAEFLGLPEFPGKQELIDGELIELPPAKKYHSEIAKILVEVLKRILHESRIWTETGYQLKARRWLTPDVSVSWPDQEVFDGYFQGAPMLAIEIASRGNTGEELETKTKLYLEHGAQEVWILYPGTRTMVISHKDNVQRVFEGESYYCKLINLDVVSDFWAAVE